MSNFNVTVHSAKITPHPNAERLELLSVGDYHVVVGKDQFKDGDLVAYLPEQSLIPQKLIEEMGLEGRLAGPQKNRVKAIRLRGELSQGLAYKPAAPPEFWQVGSDVQEYLGVSKYEQPIPVSMAGIQLHSPTDFLRTYTDIENIKAFPDVLIPGEVVSVTEKQHGSCTIVTLDGDTQVVSSKGISAKGLVLADEPKNVYWRVVHEYNLFDKLQVIREITGLDKIILFGETIGVQDLRYGLQPGELAFYAFDIYTETGYIGREKFQYFCNTAGIPMVAELYFGPYSKEKLLELTSGNSVLPGANHIREGVVVRAEPPRYDPDLGRVILKSISPSYLLRKGDSELQ